jgi:hypothetical protein
MGLAMGANCFGAQHAVRSVDTFLDGLRLCGFGKTRPTATGVKLGVGIE